MSVVDYKRAAKRSDYEVRFYAAMKRLSPDLLNDVEAEHRFHPVRRWRFDFAWVGPKVAVEVDGGQFKALGGRHNGDPDRFKMNTATSMGWRVLRFSGKQVTDKPLECIELLNKCLQT